MNRLRPILLLIGILCSPGCASLSADPRVVGTYVGTNGEALIFTSDARVFHARTVNGEGQRTFLGYFCSRRGDDYSLGFAGPDTSPFLGTSFEVSKDFSTVTANWDDSYQPDPSWQTTYLKSAQ